MHAGLSAFAERHGLFYVHDIWSDMSVRDWAAARRMNAEFVRRAKYFIVQDAVTLRARKDKAWRARTRSPRGTSRARRAGRRSSGRARGACPSSTRSSTGPMR